MHFTVDFHPQLRPKDKDFSSQPAAVRGRRSHFPTFHVENRSSYSSLWIYLTRKREKVELVIMVKIRRCWQKDGKFKKTKTDVFFTS